MSKAFSQTTGSVVDNQIYARYHCNLDVSSTHMCISQASSSDFSSLIVVRPLPQFVPKTVALFLFVALFLSKECVSYDSSRYACQKW